MIVRSVHSLKRLPCAFAFNNNYFLVDESRPFFFFYGKCTKCLTGITGECSRSFDDKSKYFDIQIKTFDTRHIPHNKKKIRLRLNSRKTVIKRLQRNKVVNYRKERAVEIMKIKEQEPADLQTSGVLRNVRQKAFEMLIGLEGPRDPLESLVFLKKNKDFGIHFVTGIPFCLIYCLEEQKTVWELLVPYRPIIKIDSSGTFSKKIKIEGMESAYIMLYQIVTSVPKLHEKTIPVSQMLSARQDVNKIELWLNATFTSISKPVEVVTDGSAALCNAVSLAFNFIDYGVYLNQCFQVLKGPSSNIPIIHCYIRQDRAHLIHAVTRWKVFKNKSCDIKDFYTRSVAFCIEATTLKEIKDVLFAIFVVSNSPFISPDSECGNQKKWLISKFKTFERDPVDTIINDTRSESFHDVVEEENEKIQNDLLKNNLFRSWINEIFNDAKKFFQLTEYNHDSMINIFYCPNMERNILYTFSQVVTWSNVMQQFFKAPDDVATTSHIEEYFKDLRLFNDTVRTANRFYLSHYKSIKADMILAYASIQEKNLEKSPETKCSNINTDSSLRNKVTKTKKKTTNKLTKVAEARTRPTNLIKNVNNLGEPFINNPIQASHNWAGIPVIENGNILGNRAQLVIFNTILNTYIQFSFFSFFPVTQSNTRNHKFFFFRLIFKMEIKFFDL